MLGHEIDHGTIGNGLTFEMSLFSSSVVAGVTIDDGDVRRECSPASGQNVWGLNPDWTIPHPPSSLVLRTQFSAAPLVCGIPVVAVDNLQLKPLAAEMGSGALSQ